MEDIVRDTLKKLIAQYGIQLCYEPQKVEGFLRDYCGQYKREINVLTIAARQRVPEELLKLSDTSMDALVVHRLAQQLHEDVGVDKGLALWAVNTWAVALGRADSDIASSVHIKEDTTASATGVDDEFTLKEAVKNAHLGGTIRPRVGTYALYVILFIVIISGMLIYLYRHNFKTATYSPEPNTEQSANTANTAQSVNTVSYESESPADNADVEVILDPYQKQVRDNKIVLTGRVTHGADLYIAGEKVSTTLGEVYDTFTATCKLQPDSTNVIKIKAMGNGNGAAFDGTISVVALPLVEMKYIPEEVRTPDVNISLITNPSFTVEINGQEVHPDADGMVNYSHKLEKGQGDYQYYIVVRDTAGYACFTKACKVTYIAPDNPNEKTFLQQAQKIVEDYENIQFNFSRLLNELMAGNILLDKYEAILNNAISLREDLLRQAKSLKASAPGESLYNDLVMTLDSAVNYCSFMLDAGKSYCNNDTVGVKSATTKADGYVQLISQYLKDCKNALSAKGVVSTLKSTIDKNIELIPFECEGQRMLIPMDWEVYEKPSDTGWHTTEIYDPVDRNKCIYVTSSVSAGALLVDINDPYSKVDPMADLPDDIISFSRIDNDTVSFLRYDEENPYEDNGMIKILDRDFMSFIEVHCFLPRGDKWLATKILNGEE